ncbi:MAG: hypothetical protein QXS79_00330 [Candidatus Bathyarchaeia archaeon]
MPEEIWFYLTIVLGATTVALVVLFLIEKERRRYLKDETKPVKGDVTVEKLLPTGRSVSDEFVREVKGKLRILDVEREILSYAIRRLYEAQAEGRITSEERDALAKKYREDLERVKEEIARGETIMALNELERMREEFIKMFSERLEIIDKRIEELKAVISPRPTEQTVKPLGEEVKVEEAREQAPMQEERVERPAVQKRRKEAVKPKAAEGGEVGEEAERPSEGGEADKSIEKIVAEIEKVLSRLSQIETEE